MFIPHPFLVRSMKLIVLALKMKPNQAYICCSSLVCTRAISYVFLRGLTYDLFRFGLSNRLNTSQTSHLKTKKVSLILQACSRCRTDDETEYVKRKVSKNKRYIWFNSCLDLTV